MLAEQDEESKQVKVAVENPEPLSVVAEASEKSGADEESSFNTVKTEDIIIEAEEEDV